MNRKLKIIILTSLVICAISLIIYFYLNPYNMSIKVKANFKGYGIMLYNPNKSDIHNSFIVDMEKQKTFNYYVKFVNNSGYDNKFVLLVYLNYKQISFYLENANNLIDSYTFDLKNGDEKMIPIHFPINNLENSTNSLIIPVLAGANKHTSELNKTSDFYGIIGRYTLKISDKPDKNVLVPENADKSFNFNDNFTGILLNKDTQNAESIKLPKLKYNVKPNERVDFLLRAGGYKKSKNYLAWITVGWKQIPFNNADNFWYFKVPNNYIARKNVSFIAPKKKGLYEVCCFLVPNPWNNMDVGINEDRNISTSFRFTLNVE